MHDPTEGGLLQGIWELAEASKVGFTVYEARIAILPETRQVCTAFKLDPLRLMSSGCLLLSVENHMTKTVLRRLRRNDIPASLIGRMTYRRCGRKLVGLDGAVQEIGPSERDEIYRVIESYRMG
jgi:hydrogenase expression/formation protein HypE